MRAPKDPRPPWSCAFAAGMAISDLNAESTIATANAISTVSPSRRASSSALRNASQVVMMTIGFTTGAATRKAMANCPLRVASMPVAMSGAAADGVEREVGADAAGRQVQ